MSITIELPDGAEEQLAQRAARIGRSKEFLAGQAVLSLLALFALLLGPKSGAYIMSRKYRCCGFSFVEVFLRGCSLRLSSKT